MTGHVAVASAALAVNRFYRDGEVKRGHSGGAQPLKKQPDRREQKGPEPNPSSELREGKAHPI